MFVMHAVQTNLASKNVFVWIAFILCRMSFSPLCQWSEAKWCE